MENNPNGGWHRGMVRCIYANGGDSRSRVKAPHGLKGFSGLRLSLRELRISHLAAVRDVSFRDAG